jgi:hypothetical protein
VVDGAVANIPLVYGAVTAIPVVDGAVALFLLLM